MLRQIVNPVLVKELELDRPPRSWAERIFRLSLFVVCATGIALTVLKVFFDRRAIESGDGNGLIGVLVGGIFITCFFYSLHYMAWRFAKSRIVKYAWLSVVSLIALLVLLALSDSLLKL
jgi:hypothetical protein